MKSIIVKVVAVVAAVLAIVSTSYGAGGGEDAEKLKIELVERKDHVVALHFRKPEKQLIKIRIYDTAANTVVFIDWDKKHDVGVIKYDLSHLPKGLYKIEVTAGTAVYEKNIEL